MSLFEWISGLLLAAIGFLPGAPRIAPAPDLVLARMGAALRTPPYAVRETMGATH